MAKQPRKKGREKLSKEVNDYLEKCDRIDSKIPFCFAWLNDRLALHRERVNKQKLYEHTNTQVPVSVNSEYSYSSSYLNSFNEMMMNSGDEEDIKKAHRRIESRIKLLGKNSSVAKGLKQGRIDFYRHLKALKIYD